MKKQKPFTQRTPLVEERIHQYNGVKVAVRIDYLHETISLIELTDTNNGGKVGAKKWVFAERGITYMDGWREILTAMEHAIYEAERSLSIYQDDKQKRDIEAAAALDKAVLA